jgi:hypothetical protein
MNTIIKFVKKNWTVLSIVGTILSSLATGAWYVVERIAKTETTIATLNDWVQDHDDAIQAQHDDLTVLKEDERLREAGLLK